MKKKYRLPLCWFGQPKTEYVILPRKNKEGKRIVERVTKHLKEDIQPGCQCDTARQAFMCSTGHLSECHVGKSCLEAQCSKSKKRVGGIV